MIQLRHGVFLPPFHPMDENPAACMDRDLELMQWLDRLGFHEAWIGEHHSAGWETISSPELFIAVAAERTRSIRFGTGVISLPYHNPLMTANRIIQLDHHTRGRVMFGAGPGLLASDALMLGIDPNTQRDRMAEALDVILRFFRGEIVTEKTDWYTFVNARAHLRPYTRPHPEVAVVSAVTPSGGRLAGKYNLSMICVAATNPFGYDALAANWQIANDIAAEQGRTMDPSRLRLVGPMHIAETRAKAFENCRFGFERYLGYLNNNQPRFIVPPGQDAAEWFVENKFGVIGTPDDAIALIERLQGEAGRVRRVPAPGAQLGGLGGDQALLRAVCPLRHAAFLRRQHPARRVVRLVHRASRRTDREAVGRGARDVRQARGRACVPRARHRWCGRRPGARPGDMAGPSSSPCSTIRKLRRRCSPRRSGWPSCAVRRGSTRCWFARRPKPWSRPARRC